MARSLQNGDYRLILAVESASRPDSWYRVCADVRTGALSCDCPRWIFARRGEVQRGCKHTEWVATLLAQQAAHDRFSLPQAPRWQRMLARLGGGARTATDDPLVLAAQTQWPGLTGTWQVERRDTEIGDIAAHVVLLRLRTPSGREASGVVAFARRHQPNPQRLARGVAGWCGYAIAAEIARQAGLPLAGRPPEHFRLPRRSGPGAVGLADILRVGETTDLGDGLHPTERAENTLRLFLGDLYADLMVQGYLDVPSQHFRAEERVYRMRRDPRRQRDRRLRVFERARYVRDLCIVRAQVVPEADHFLTVFLRLISDELGLLEVVQKYNIFPPYSDDQTRETVPPSWKLLAG